MAEPGETQKRQIAYKIKIADILRGRYVKEEGWLPNYVDLGDVKVSRANIIGVLVSKDADEEGGSTSFMLDDGSGRISLRFFEFSDELWIGDIVNVVGRPREFGSERYIVPEFVRKVTDPKWVELRKLELAQQKHEAHEVAQENIAHSATVGPSAGSSGPAVSVSDSGTLVVESEDFNDNNPVKLVYGAIKKLDGGSGVGFDEIIVETKIDEVDGHIKKLLEQGDIFEIKPGRYKVLE